MSSIETKQVEKDEDGIRLDRWFQPPLSGLAHGRLEKLLRTGQVRLDGKRAKASDRLAAGPDAAPAAGGGPCRGRGQAARARRSDPGSLEEYVLYMDASVIVLNKPPGLATQGGSGLDRHVDGMLDSLAFEKKQRPRLVHRLDRDTSGVLVVARTVPAAAALAKSLAQRDASKIYWALTRACPSRSAARSRRRWRRKDGPRGRDERMAVSGRRRRQARHHRLRRAGAGGRRNSPGSPPSRSPGARIRSACIWRALGTPIVGDFKYGGNEARGKGEIADKLHLHARSIDIAHPDGGRLQRHRAAARAYAQIVGAVRLQSRRRTRSLRESAQAMRRFYKAVAVDEGLLYSPRR